MTNKLVVTRETYATIRTGPSKAGGEIRRAPLGTELEYAFQLPALPNGDKWAVLTSIDPKSGHPWLFGGLETSAFIAVYVGGTEYAKLYPAPTDGGGYDDGWRDGYAKRTAEIIAFLKG